MLYKLQRGLYYFVLKPMAKFYAQPMIWACRNWVGIPAYLRVKELYKSQALLRPYYYRGVERAFNYSNKLGLDSFSILEFGVAEGNGILYIQSLVQAIRSHPDYRKKRIKIVGYDTFSGLPAVESSKDGQSIWQKGDYPGDLEKLETYIDHQLVHLEPGLFSESIPRSRELLRAFPPLFVIVDCDLYTSTKSIFQELFPDLVPSLSYWFFDDTNLNFYSSRVGEQLALQEFGQQVGNEYEFIPDYAALEERLSPALALMHCYHCVNNHEYVDLTRKNTTIQKLQLDVEKYTQF